MAARELWQSRMLIIVSCVSIGLVGAYSGLLAWRTDLRLQYQAAAAKFQRPPLLNGLALRLNRSLIPEWRPDLHRRYLVFVSSDKCQYSRADAPRWAALLRDVSLAPDVSLLFLSTNGLQIPSELSAIAAGKGIPASVYTVTSSSRLAADTAIAWTPETLVLDSDLRVRLSSETLTPVVAQQIRERLSGGGH